MSTKPNAPLNETLYGLVHDLFRAGGTPVHPNNQAQIDRIAKNLANAISKGARLEALTLVERLQKAVKNGFETFGKSLEKSHERQDAIRKRVETELEGIGVKIHALQEQNKVITNNLAKTTEVLDRMIKMLESTANRKPPIT